MSGNLPTQKVLPLKGHKSLGMFIRFETACECGWYSCPHSERREAWSEWRTHVLSHGGEREPYEKAAAREKRQLARYLEKIDAAPPAISASPTGRSADPGCPKSILETPND